GLQGMVEHFGGELAVLPYPMHGKPSTVKVLGGRIFEGLPATFTAGRYHSLYAVRERLPAVLAVTAESEDGVVMAVEHRERPIAMATVPFLETQRLTKGMKDIGDYIEKETGLKVQSDVPTSYVAVVEAMCANKLDVGWVSPLAYILARQKCGADMQLASINSAGKTTYHGFIIARSAADIQKVEDLKGKRFAWVDPTSTSGYLYP